MESTSDEIAPALSIALYELSLFLAFDVETSVQYMDRSTLSLNTQLLLLQATS